MSSADPPSPAAAAGAGDILDDPLEEVQRVVAAARADGVSVAGTGGVAIALRCPSARVEPLRREYGDLDFAARARDVRQIQQVFVGLGYEPDTEFNSLHGESRLFFLDHARRREADVFLDAIRGCHELPVTDRLHAPTLTPADLLLSKLQVRETNRKDLLDIYALLLDHDLTEDDTGISTQRIAEVCGGDWGWWRTVSEVSERAQASADEILGGGDPRSDRVRTGLATVRALIEEAPKTRRWRMRARVGDRVRWYESPEELQH
jgi:hypothetical protein